MGVTEDQFRKMKSELYNAGLSSGQPHRVERPDHGSFAESTESNERRPDQVFANRELRSILEAGDFDLAATLPASRDALLRL